MWRGGKLDGHQYIQSNDFAALGTKLVNLATRQWQLKVGDGKQLMKGDREGAEGLERSTNVSNTQPHLCIVYLRLRI